MPCFVSDDESPVGILPGIRTLDVMTFPVVFPDGIKGFKLSMQFAFILSASRIWFNDWYPIVLTNFLRCIFCIETGVKGKHAASQF